MAILPGEIRLRQGKALGFTAEIMAEHEQTADTDLAWAAVTGIVDDLAAHG